MIGPDDPTTPTPRGAPPPPSGSVTPGQSYGGSTQPESHLPIFRGHGEWLPAVPGYAVSREVGRGGMGVVYAAHDPSFDREVAVKIMHHGQAGGRFVIESKVTARLAHPGVPPVHALGELPDGRPYLAMKLVEGRTLADHLKEQDRGADLPRLLGAFERICETVGFAHSKSIVHRDLKPSNVMLGSFGEVLVMDWGLAKEVVSGRSAGSEETGGSTASSGPAPGADETAGAVKGTPAYMAPEQARGEPVDARADVFALGGILAAVLTGKPPFAGSTAAAAVKRAAAADLADCFDRLDGAGVDAELVAVAKRCLAPDAEDRFASGREVAEAVAAYRAGVEERLRTAERDRVAAEARAEEEVNTRREAEARAAERRKRRRVQLALAAAVLLMLLGAGAFAWQADRQAADRRAAVEQAGLGVRRNVELAADLRRQYRFKEAGDLLAQAADLARGGAVDLLPVVETAQRDLAFVEKLDDIRYRKWTWVAEGEGRGGFNTRIAPREYRAAFAERDLDPGALSPAAAAVQIAASDARAELVAALDDWALYEPDPGLRDRLLEVARRADPGPWTDRLRDPAVRNDKAAVAKLAVDADPGHTPPAALTSLSELMARHHLDAVPLLSAARAAHPTDFELAFALGHRRTFAGLQIGPYEAAGAIRPGVPSVWGNLGAALLRARDYDGAVAACRRAVELAPRSAVAHSNLGHCLFESGRYDEAIAEDRRAIELDPTFAGAYINLGASLGRKGDYDASLRVLERAVELAPKSAMARANLGHCLWVLERDLEAIAEYRRAIALDPRYAKARSGFAVLLANRERYEQAIAECRAALQLDPNDVLALATLGTSLQEQGDLDGAIEAYREALKRDPRYLRVLVNLANAYGEKEKYPEAIDCARRALAVDPASSGAYVSMGIAYRETQDFVRARAAFTVAARLDPKWTLARALLENVRPAAPPPRPVER